MIHKIIVVTIGLALVLGALTYGATSVFAQLSGGNGQNGGTTASGGNGQNGGVGGSGTNGANGASANGQNGMSVFVNKGSSGNNGVFGGNSGAQSFIGNGNTPTNGAPTSGGNIQTGGGSAHGSNGGNVYVCSIGNGSGSGSVIC